MGDWSPANVNGGSIPAIDVVGKYDADNTGSTDSSAAWQAAIDDAHAAWIDGAGCKFLFGYGLFKAISLTMKSGVYVVGSGPGKLVGMNPYPVSAFTPASTGTIFTFDDTTDGVLEAGILNFGFQHDRSFAAHAIDLAATNFNYWLTLRDLTFYGFKGAAVHSAEGYTVWESVFQGLHARGCGDGANDIAVFDLNEIAGRDTNNLTFRDLKCIYPQAIGLRVVSAANPTEVNTPGMRQVKIADSMFHAGNGTDGFDVYDADMIVVDGFSDLTITGCNVADVAAGYNAVTLKGSDLTQPSNRAQIYGNNFAQPVEIETNVRDVDFGVNRWPFLASGTPAYHVKIDSGAINVSFSGRQVVENGGRFVISDAGTGTVLPPPLPAANGGGASQRRTPGNITVNVSAFASLAQLAGNSAGTWDMVLKDVHAGQTIHIGLEGFWSNETTAGRLDVATIVSAAAVNYVSSGGSAAATNGIIGAYGGASSNTGFGCVVQYVVQAGDIDSSGQMTLRVLAKSDSGATKTLVASSANPFAAWARNVG